MWRKWTATAGPRITALGGSSSPRTPTAFFTPGVRILSLSDGTLRKLMAEEPTLAAKLLLNISRMLCGRLIKANSGTDI